MMPMVCHRADQELPVPYFGFLTGLRGLAILSVTLFHLTYPFRTRLESPPPLLAPLIPLVNRFWFGVDLFFLISGYGIAASLANRQNREGCAGALSFAANRAIRIYPVYWTCCLAATALAFCSSRITHVEWALYLPHSVKAILASAFLLEPITKTKPLLPVVTWALNCEMGFYSVTALGILLRRQIRDTLLLSIAVVMALFALTGQIPYLKWLFDYWPQFTCGLLVFTAIAERNRNNFINLLVVLSTLLILAALGFATAQPRIGYTAIGGMILFGAWRFDALLSRLGARGGLMFCGRISYPLFLVHVPVGTSILHLGQRIVPSHSLLFLLTFLTGVFVCMAVSWVIMTLVETPAAIFAKRYALKH